MKRALAVAAGGAVALAPVLLSGVASAQGAPNTVYVSPTGGTPEAADTSCNTAAYSVIDAAIEAVTSRGTVVVCEGTYHQHVTVNKTLTLQGRPDAIIDGSGLTGPEDGGIRVTADWVTVRGLTVEHGYNGIGVSGNHATIIGNTLTGMVSHPAVGVLVSGSYARVADNTITGVGGFGIAVQDLYGYDPNYQPGQPPAAYNQVIGNRVVGTAGAGIVLQSFLGNGGVYGNVVRNNVVENGTTGCVAPGGQDGPGVLLGSGDWPYMVTRCPDSTPTATGRAPATGGGVHNNIVQGNQLSDNGWPGVTVIGATEGSGQDMNGNVVTGNSIGTNNLLGITLSFLPAEVPETTGILVASPTLLSIRLVGNVIHDNYYGIWKNSLISARGLNSNRYINVDVPVHMAP